MKAYNIIGFIVPRNLEIAYRKATQIVTVALAGRHTVIADYIIYYYLSFGIGFDKSIAFKK